MTIQMKATEQCSVSIVRQCIVENLFWECFICSKLGRFSEKGSLSDLMTL